ncbi:MCE family protein [Solimonas sp. K1W22B-7]|uniref:MlaD family protein n=1 Tax=Solimonas sp. K1W22B-7 TaxID=2303331 RepID=UPI000E335C80|nr:MlaD family protein [Solimonas sp. K1W22B-7]AXQ29757.1 MCE family protein [Solimonas sp. K1W22B-7]
MINSKWNLAMVGGFVLLGLVSLVLTLAVLAGRTGSTDTYYTVYANVSGLKFGSKVLFEGYPVGQVEEVEPYVQQGQMRFRVRMSVTEGWKIPSDSIARSTASGVLAPQTIEISAGSSPKALEPGATITAGGMGGLMSSVASVTGNIDELTEQALLPLLQNLNRQVTLLGTILQEDIRPLAQNSNKVMVAASRDVPTILGHLERVSARADRLLSPQRVEALGRTIDHADQTLLSLRNGSRQLEQAAPDVLVALRELRLTIESMSRRSEGVAQNLETSTRNLQEFSRQIRRSPGTLLRAPEPPREDGPPSELEKKP